MAGKKLNHSATVDGVCGTTATMANNSEIMTTIQGLRAMLETLEAQVMGNKAVAVPKAPVAEKPKRQASDALKAWNAYVDKVKADMVASGWTHPESGKPVTRKDAMIEAKARRDTDPDAYKPKPKPLAAVKVADGEAKPKRVLTEEHKAAMAAGRKAAAERRKAEKAASAVIDKEAPPSPRPRPKSVTFTPPPLPQSDDEDASSLLPISIKGKKFLYNPDTNGCYKRTTDGNKGEWAGLLDPVKQTIDASVKESDLDGVYEDDE
jgi:hypothetical protein